MTACISVIILLFIKRGKNNIYKFFNLKLVLGFKLWALGIKNYYDR